MKRLGVLTNGGDCPGLNAAVRAVAKAASQQAAEVVGFRDGYVGLVTGDCVSLTPAAVQGLLPRGGTFLGTSRLDPFHWPDAQGAPVDRSADAAATIERLGLEALIVIGGDGSLGAARDLHHLGLPVVGVPKTIDNDICCTDASLGFDTAVATAVDAIDRLHTTAESHHRVMVLELMGRHTGWIALAAGVAGGADVILIPELPYHLSAVVVKIEDRVRQGRLFSIVVAAEGALAAGEGTAGKTSPVGGVGERLAARLRAAMGREVRATVLGHIQRGGGPSSTDRLLATRFGAAAVDLALNRAFGHMVALQGGRVRPVPLADAVAGINFVPPDADLLRAARVAGASLADSPPS